jgi:MFS family permease
MLPADEHAKPLDFYGDSPRGRILRTMTMHDITYWATDAFIAVVLVLFVIQYINGGSATHVGLAFFLYRAVAAFTSFPVGRFFDSHRGYLDEVWGLAASSFIAGIAYVFLSFSHDLWQLYLAMVAIGFASVLQLTSWRTLFFNNIGKEQYSRTLGTYQTFFFLCQGVAVALGGLMGDTFGFNAVVFYGGIVVFLGGFLPLGIKYLVAKT